MYNLELTANKVGFCLYTLVTSVCLTFFKAHRSSREKGIHTMASVATPVHTVMIRSKTNPTDDKPQPF